MLHKTSGLIQRHVEPSTSFVSDTGILLITSLLRGSECGIHLHFPLIFYCLFTWNLSNYLVKSLVERTKSVYRKVRHYINFLWLWVNSIYKKNQSIVQWENGNFNSKQVDDEVNPFLQRCGKRIATKLAVERSLRSHVWRPDSTLCPQHCIGADCRSWGWAHFFCWLCHGMFISNRASSPSQKSCNSSGRLARFHLSTPLLVYFMDPPCGSMGSG